MSVDSPIFILDSFALLAYLNGEVGMARIQELLGESSQGRCRMVLPVINLGEVLYITEREVGLVEAQAVLAAVEGLPIEILPATKEAVLEAAHLKANYPIAYANAFAVAAAKDYNGMVLTGDPEFESVEGLVAIEWLK